MHLNLLYLHLIGYSAFIQRTIEAYFGYLYRPLDIGADRFVRTGGTFNWMGKFLLHCSVFTISMVCDELVCRTGSSITVSAFKSWT